MFEKGLVVGLVVSVLAFYNGNLRSNPVVVYNFSEKLLLKRTKGDVDFFIINRLYLNHGSLTSHSLTQCIRASVQKMLEEAGSYFEKDTLRPCPHFFHKVGYFHLETDPF